MLDERLEVRIDHDTMAVLKAASARRGVSIGELVRQSVAAYLAQEDRAERMAAAERLCALELDDDFDWESWEEEYTVSKLEGLA